jgi:hypothetical protein
VIDAVHQRADGLGHRGVEQIRPDRCYRVHAEHQDQQRRHQGATAHAGLADQQTDYETR